MKKIFCIGEILIDFIGQPSMGIAKSRQFAKMAGGAPANVAAAIAKLGGDVALLANLGADSFGDFLLATLHDLKIDTSCCLRSGKTTLAFVAIDHNGERDFEFYRGDDGDFNLKNINLPLLSSDSIIHFGSAMAFLGGDLRDSYFALLELACENNCFISFDPNYRENLITNDELARFIHDCRTFIACADLVKVSEIEAQIISGEDDLRLATNYLRGLGAKTVVVTLGAKGALLVDKHGARYLATRRLQKVVDTTGAGDAFIGALLLKISEHEEINWDAFVTFANFVGACTCCNYGAISAMPTMRQFLEFLG